MRGSVLLLVVVMAVLAGTEAVELTTDADKTVRACGIYQAEVRHLSHA